MSDFMSDSFKTSHPERAPRGDRTEAYLRSELAAEVRLREQAEEDARKAIAERDRALAELAPVKEAQQKAEADAKQCEADEEACERRLEIEIAARAKAEGALAECRAALATCQSALDLEHAARAKSDERYHAAVMAFAEEESSEKPEPVMADMSVIVKRPGKKDATLVVSTKKGTVQ